MSFNQISFGEPKRNESPSVSTRSPTESGPATLLSVTSGVDIFENGTVPAPNSAPGDRIYFFCRIASISEVLLNNPPGFTLAGQSSDDIAYLFYLDVVTPPSSLTLPEFETYVNGDVAWIAATVRRGSTHTISSFASQSNNNTNDPPAVTPSDTPGEYLVISFVGFNNGNQEDDPGGSTGYTEFAYVGNGLTNPHAYGQQNQVTITTSENPDSFVFPPSGPTGNSWQAVTVAVKHSPPSVAGPDHGDLDGLPDDDHPQYSLVDGTRAFTGEVAGVTPTLDPSLATKAYVDSVAGGGSGGGSFTEHFDDANHTGAAFFRGFSDAESEDSTTIEDTSPNIIKTKRYGKLSLYHPGGDASNELHAVTWAYAPAGDFWIETAFRWRPTASNYAMVGTIATDGTTYGAGNQRCMFHYNNLTDIRLYNYTNFSTLGSGASSVYDLDTALPASANPVMYILMHYTSSTGVWRLAYSNDGISWIKDTTTLTSSFTTANVGLIVSTNGGANPFAAAYEYIAAYTGTPTYAGW